MPASALTFPHVWRADALAEAPTRVVATGDAMLNAQLPGGGWPVGALTELLQPIGVHNEWRLLLPALGRSGDGQVVLVGPPHVPFVPALNAQGLRTQRLLWVVAASPSERLWAAEQALRCAQVDAVLAWLPQARSDQLRRLQMAAADYAKLLFVVRPAQALKEASPAVLRLWLGPLEPGGAPSEDDRLQVYVLKRRGPPLEKVVRLQARPAVISTLLAASHALDCTAASA